MLIHELKPKNKKKKAKRVGRGGKRGTYSGRGNKGQKARGKIRPDFRGGNAPLWKVFPKIRGSSKKTKKKHRFFRLKLPKARAVNLDQINKVFGENEIVNNESLAKHGLIREKEAKVKILGRGALDKKLSFSELAISQSAVKKIIEAGGCLEKQ